MFVVSKTEPSHRVINRPARQGLRQYQYENIQERISAIGAAVFSVVQ
jgi:Rieske Fe-S protein